jgi:hypothetical protein
MALRRLARGRLEAAADPDEILSGLFGPRFADYRRRWALAEKGFRPDRPLHLDVDLTTVCDLACPMCPAGRPDEGLFPGLGLFMSETTYQAALREASAWKLPSLRLGVTGEPLLVPEIARWVAEAKAADVLDVALITNGQRLDEETGRALIESGLTKLMISVDAATARTYAEVRPGGNFEKLVENLRNFLALRAALKNSTPLVRLSFVEMTANVAERDLFREKFSVSADWLVFQNYLNARQRPGSDLAPTRIAPPDRCPDPLTRLALQVDGGLFPCCSDFGRLSPLGRFPEASLAEVWNSKEALALCDPAAPKPTACRRCLAASRPGPMRSDSSAEGETEGEAVLGSSDGQEAKTLEDLERFWPSFGSADLANRREGNRPASPWAAP